MADTYVLDSYAMLALLGREAGSTAVSKLLQQAQDMTIRLSMTWVNLGEVTYIVERRWGRTRAYQVLANIEATAIEAVPIGRTLALQAAHIKAKHPLALADAFSAALAVERQATLVTGDPEFEVLEGVLQIQWLPHTESGPSG